MRTLSAGQLAAVASEHVTACHLVEIEFASGTVYVTDAARDVVWNGNTYLGAGRAGGIETIRETLNGEATGLKFTLAGAIASYLSAALTEHVQGKPVRVRVAFFNANEQLIDTPLIEWAGLTDPMSVADKTEQSVIAVTAESRYAQFARPKVRRHSHADQLAEYPGDLFFEYAASMIEKSIIFPNKEWFKQNT